MRKIDVAHGFGVDENTGLYIENDTATVYGNWGVWIVDTTAAKFPQAEQFFSAENIRVHYLTEGDSFNLTSGIVASTKSSIVEQETMIETNNNIFGLDQGLRTIKSLISSNSTVSEGYSREEDPTCLVVFEKDERTRGYLDDDLYTIQNLLLHVKTKGDTATTVEQNGTSTTIQQNGNSASIQQTVFLKFGLMVAVLRFIFQILFY